MLGKDTKSEVDKLNEQLFSWVKPLVYAGSSGEEVRYIKGFEETCILLNQHIPKDPKSMTVLGFYQALETIQQQVKERKRQAAKNGK